MKVKINQTKPIAKNVVKIAHLVIMVSTQRGCSSLAGTSNMKPSNKPHKGQSIKNLTKVTTSNSMKTCMMKSKILKNNAPKMKITNRKLKKKAKHIKSMTHMCTCLYHSHYICTFCKGLVIDLSLGM